MPVAIAVLVVALVLVVCGTASSADLFSVQLPLLGALPRDCGYVLGVKEGDTCESLA